MHRQAPHSSFVTIPEPGTATYAATRRLQKDYQKLAQDPIDGITALPNESNILEWNYCLRGSPDTDYEGGYYWGKVIFKPDFPWSPPAILMITPNGRFETNVRLCLSISDYHPESWNPGWTVASILVGLHSFMNDKTLATGVICSTQEECRALAKSSKAYNLKSDEFCRVFPGFAKEWGEQLNSTSSSSSSLKIRSNPNKLSDDEPAAKRSKPDDEVIVID